MTPASASTTIGITGVSAGTTHVQVGPTRYEIVVTAPAHTHRYEALVTAPTCTEGGYTTYTCACGDSYVADEVPAAGHSYADGVCTVCGHIAGIAVNVTTGESYAVLADALEEARKGDTVKLLTDAADGYVMVYPGITLDLNGHKLTADYVVGFNTAHVIDSGDTGKLIVPVKNVVLDEDNRMVPVYDGEGYIFSGAGFAIRKDDTYTGEGMRIYAIACPNRMDAVEQLKDGCAGNNLQVAILLTWGTDQGTGSQQFVFNDAVVAKVYSSNKGTMYDYGQMFSMVITGFESVENLKANVVLVSGTNAECVSTAEAPLD